MMSERLPWGKFVWADWENDAALALCSMAAQGFWMRLLCMAVKEGGYLLISDMAPTPVKLARIVRADVADVEAWLAELESEGVFSRRGDGVIYSRRIVKESQTAQRNRSNGAKGGNPSLRKDKGNSKRDNPPGQPPEQPPVQPGTPTPVKAEENRVEENREREEVGPRKRGARLPTDWQPDAELIAYGVGLGFQHAKVISIAERFRLHWHSSSNRNAVKIHWGKAFQGWLRDDADKLGLATGAVKARPRNLGPAVF